MEIKIDEEWFSGAVAADLLWNSENAECLKMRKAAFKVATYYMTFEQVAQYLGSVDEAEEYFV